MSSKSSEQTGDAPEDLPAFREVYQEDPCEMKNLIYGNGFSQALDPSFSYSSLYDPILDCLDTRLAEKIDDFVGDGDKDVEGLFLLVHEVAKQQAGQAHSGKKTPGDAVEDTNRFRRDLRSQLPEAFANVIIDLHRGLPDSIPNSKQRGAAEFLSMFDRILTLNYDLLWLLLEGVEDSDFPIPEHLHGSVATLTDQWDNYYRSTDNPQIGRLRIHQIESEYYENALDELSGAVNQGKMPAIVVGSLSERKENKIEALDHALNRVHRKQVVKDTVGSLYTFGWSMDTKQPRLKLDVEANHKVNKYRDHHILDAIAGAEDLERLCVGVYSEESAWGYKAKIEQLQAIRKRDKGLPEFDVAYFDSETCF